MRKLPGKSGMVRLQLNESRTNTSSDPITNTATFFCEVLSSPYRELHRFSEADRLEIVVSATIETVADGYVDLVDARLSFD
jgi:hypothetical protein